MKNTPDNTSALPWHIAQVYSLTDRQRAKLLLSFYACWQTNETLLTALSEQPTTKTQETFRTLAECSRTTMETILRSASLPIPENTNH